MVILLCIIVAILSFFAGWGYGIKSAIDGFDYMNGKDLDSIIIERGKE